MHNEKYMNLKPVKITLYFDSSNVLKGSLIPSQGHEELQQQERNSAVFRLSPSFDKHQVEACLKLQLCANSPNIHTLLWQYAEFHGLRLHHRTPHILLA